jgi:polyisoprenoid-binding protein YceI
MTNPLPTMAQQMAHRTFPFAAFAALGLVAGLGLSSAARADQKLLPAQSDIVFVSKQMGVPVEGHFKKFDAQVAFDPAKPEAAKISLSVDVASGSMGDPLVDAELAKPGWFGAAKYPQATFQSTQVKALGGGKFEVAGKLALKGVTQALKFPVTLSTNGTTTLASGTVPIQRTTFHIGDGEWSDTSLVADEVQIKFKFALSGVGKF